jgi:hypothetical protein
MQREKLRNLDENSSQQLVRYSPADLLHLDLRAGSISHPAESARNRGPKCPARVDSAYGLE